MTTLTIEPEVHTPEILIFNGPESKTEVPEGHEAEVLEFPEMKETEPTIPPPVELHDRFVMVQAVVSTPQGNMPITQVLKGNIPIDEDDINKKVANFKSNIIQLNGNQQANNIQTLFKILVEDYGYMPITLDAVFNFIPQTVQETIPPASKIIL